ncbi:hypothetical protein B1R27_02280 [Streptomyces sp. GKU 895]|nr:hypothetical protein B1R27_02280 [Streptomyces sp. GKU 895]
MSGLVVGVLGGTGLQGRGLAHRLASALPSSGVSAWAPFLSKYGGRLRNAHQVESLVANLISVDRR